MHILPQGEKKNSSLWKSENAWSIQEEKNIFRHIISDTMHNSSRAN